MVNQSQSLATPGGQEPPQEYYPQRVAVSKNGMAATAHPGATQAAVEMLAAGGNAVDAAVAAAWALGVCEPQASGIGGQTMMLIHIAETRRTIALDGSSRAPNRIIPGSFSKNQLLNGYVASTIPSTPAVLEYARQTYGSLPLSRLLEPAVRLAENGFAVSDLYHRLLKRELKRLRKGAAGPIFLKNGEKAHSAGSLFKQPALASTLRQLAKKGIDGFYTGAIARTMADDMARNHGLIHLDDLAQIPWPIERRPLSGRFENKRILTFPPPGAGRTLIEMLNIFHQFPPSQRDLDSPLG
ncbi:MAG: gamma-glutamyltransferase, partial [Candidatus Hinthialibacter sp.]